MTASNDRLRGGAVKRLHRIRVLLGHYGAVAEESGNAELFALVHDLDDVLTARGRCDLPPRRPRTVSKRRPRN